MTFFVITKTIVMTVLLLFWYFYLQLDENFQPFVLLRRSHQWMKLLTNIISFEGILLSDKKLIFFILRWNFDWNEGTFNEFSNKRKREGKRFNVKNDYSLDHHKRPQSLSKFHFIDEIRKMPPTSSLIRHSIKFIW